MHVSRVFNLTHLNGDDVGQSWITCGVLYALTSSTQRRSTLFAAYDLYRGKFARVNMPWINEFGNANSVSYNPQDRKLYINDNGHLINIPLQKTFDTETNSSVQ